MAAGTAISEDDGGIAASSGCLLNRLLTDMSVATPEITGRDKGGGLFTAKGRRAALNAALPLLASYFADAATWDLEVSSQIGTAEADGNRDKELEDFAAGARLRASLAAADRLLQILNTVAAQPTFRYTQVSAESVGTIRGRLDLARYSRQQGRINVPRRYPIRLVERESATPENVLAAYAAMWIRRDLAAAPRYILPSASPEARELERLEQALRRSMGLPLLAGTAEHATAVWRRSSLDALIDTVIRRLEAGHVARPEPYQELVEWVRSTREGAPVAELGAREWSFYGQAFDTKLFEIWCLVGLANQITANIGAPVGPLRSLAARNRGPMFVWNVGGGTLRLYFQPSLGALTAGGVVWSYDGGGDLRGFPDLAVTADTFTGRSLALFDPKLRRRSASPTEEIYKLLGYFGNLHHDKPPIGAILYYSPSLPTDRKLTSAAGGEIHAIGLDPELSLDQQFSAAAGLAVRITGLGETSLTLLRESAADKNDEGAEHAAEVRQAIAVDMMRRAASVLPAASLAPTRKQTAATLQSVWARLSDEAQTMIVTAEYFANTAPDDADHSGPLLGLAAAIERLLREAIFDPAAAESPGVLPPGQTLGSCLRTLDLALRNHTDPVARAIRGTLQRRPQIDQQQLRAIVPAAQAMNRNYRIPAAHAELVFATTWAQGREVILHPSNGLLPQLAHALVFPPVPPVAGG